jgi:hypothetical protein
MLASTASATAAREAAVASTNNAATAARSAENQGIHAVAWLRQEWINELRGRVAQAHARLSNAIRQAPVPKWQTAPQTMAPSA